MLLGILVAAALLRLINISSEPFWCDEVLSLDIATTFGSVSEMLRYLAQVEFHPPLYYLILRPWTALFGTTEAAVRSLSLLFSLGCVALTYRLAARMFEDRRVGLVAAGLMAVLPLQIEFGQEGRPYAMFCLMGLVAACAVWEHLDSGRKTWAVLYVAATAAGLYLHYSYGFVAVAIAAWWLVEVSAAHRERSRRLLTWAVAQAAVFVAFWPWLDNFLYKILLGGFDIFGLSRVTTPLREPNFFGDLLDSVVWVTKDVRIPAIQNLAVGLAVGLFIWVAATNRRRGGADHRRQYAVLIELAVIPAALFLLAPQSFPYTTLVQRHMIWLTVPIAITVAAVAVRAGRRKGAMLLAVLAASLLPYIVGVVGNDAYFDYDYRLEEGAEYINEHYAEGDVVIVAFSILRSDLTHYLRDDILVETLIPVDYDGRDVWRGRHTLGLVENEIQVRTPSTSRGDVFAKLDRIERKHAPGRIWIYGLTQRDYKAHDWFNEEDWRRSFGSVGDILRLDLYSRK